MAEPTTEQLLVRIAALEAERDEVQDALASARRTAAEALEQQTAMSEILRVISSSPTEVQPVFETVAESAARLCDAFDVAIFLRDGERLRLVAHYGAIPVGAIGEFSVPLEETLGGRSASSSRPGLVDVVRIAGESRSEIGGPSVALTI